MKTILLMCAVGTLLGIQASAAHAESCDGCNIVDDGDFGRSLVGETVYYDMPLDPNIAITVENVDYNRGQVIGVLNDGTWVRASARYVYTAYRANERDNISTGATIITLFGIGLRAGYCSNHPEDNTCDTSSSSGSSVAPNCDLHMWDYRTGQQMYYPGCTLN